MIAAASFDSSAGQITRGLFRPTGRAAQERLVAAAGSKAAENTVSALRGAGQRCRRSRCGTGSSREDDRLAVGHRRRGRAGGVLQRGGRHRDQRAPPRDQSAAGAHARGRDRGRLRRRLSGGDRPVCRPRRDRDRRRVHPGEVERVHPDRLLRLLGGPLRRRAGSTGPGPGRPGGADRRLPHRAQGRAAPARVQAPAMSRTARGRCARCRIESVGGTPSSSVGDEEPDPSGSDPTARAAGVPAPGGAVEAACVR